MLFIAVAHFPIKKRTFDLVLFHRELHQLTQDSRGIASSSKEFNFHLEPEMAAQGASGRADARPSHLGGIRPQQPRRAHRERRERHKQPQTGDPKEAREISAN